MDVLCRLQQRAIQTASDEVLILHQGRPVFHYSAPTCNCVATDLDGISRAFMGLTFMMLKDEGKIACLDQPLRYLFPSWQLRSKSWTLHHLLNNTSGWRYASDGHTICAPKTAVARFDTHPSCVWNALQKAVFTLSGQNFEDYLFDKIFLPLGINNVAWDIDATGRSFPRLMLSAADLAKVGVLIANKGSWKGQSLISEKALNEMFSPSQQFDPFFGLQWYLEFYDVACWWDEELLALYRSSGVKEELCCRLAALNGRVVHFGGYMHDAQLIEVRGSDAIDFLGGSSGLELLLKETKSKGLPLARFEQGKLKSAIARGKSGQQWIIMPDQELVAVRLRSPLLHQRTLCDGFFDLPALMTDLAREYDCYTD